MKENKEGIIKAVCILVKELIENERVASAHPEDVFPNYVIIRRARYLYPSDRDIWNNKFEIENSKAKYYWMHEKSSVLLWIEVYEKEESN